MGGDGKGGVARPNTHMGQHGNLRLTIAIIWQQVSPPRTNERTPNSNCIFLWRIFLFPNLFPFFELPKACYLSWPKARSVSEEDLLCRVRVRCSTSCQRCYFILCRRVFLLFGQKGNCITAADRPAGYSTASIYSWARRIENCPKKGLNLGVLGDLFDSKAEKVARILCT